MKRVLALCLALLCASSLLCVPAFATNSSTAESGYYFVDMRTQFKSIASTSGYTFSEPIVSGDFVEIARAYRNDSSRRYSSYWDVTYELTVPYTAYYDIFTSGKSRWYQYDGLGNRVYIDALFSCSTGTAASPSAKDWVFYSSWSTPRKLSAGKYTLVLSYSLTTDRVFGENYNDLVVYAPQFRLSDNDYNKENVFNKIDASLTCTSCKKQFNYSNLSSSSFWRGIFTDEECVKWPDLKQYQNKDLWICPDCGYMYNFLPGLKLPDNMQSTDKGIVVTKPDGSIETRVPVVDSSTGNVTINVNVTPSTHDHAWSEVVTVPATCNAPGTMQQTCTICGFVNTVVIPAGSHVYDEGTRIEPTCVNAGSLTQTCSLCGNKKVTTLPSLGHDWQPIKTVNTQYGEDGTLIQQGYVLYECTRCKEQYKAESQGGQVTPPPSGGGDGSGGSGGGSQGGEGDGGGSEGGGDSIWDKIWGGIGDILGFIVNGLGQVLGGIIEALVAVAKQLVEGITALFESILNVFTSVLTWGGSFGEFVGTFFSAFPPEVVTLFTLAISLSIVLMIINFFRK